MICKLNEIDKWYTMDHESLFRYKKIKLFLWHRLYNEYSNGLLSNINNTRHNHFIMFLSSQALLELFFNDITKGLPDLWESRGGVYESSSSQPK